MSRNASLSFAWPAVTPRRAAAAVWSSEPSGELETYLAAAREHLTAGRPAEAVNAWRAALRVAPGMPVPRRDAVVRLIRDTVYACARRALQAPVPDAGAARAWLERLLPAVNVLDDAGRREALRTYALLLHVSGRPREALAYYRAAAPRAEHASSVSRRSDAAGGSGSTAGPGTGQNASFAGDEFGTRSAGSGDDLSFVDGGGPADASEIARALGEALARLQISAEATVAGRRPFTGPDPMTPPASHKHFAAGTEGASSTASSDGFPARTVAGLSPGTGGDQLAEVAWRRIRAMDMLLRGDTAGALAAFPAADTPALPRAWALEGALLAAACSRWSTSLQYYRRTMDAREFSGRPPGQLHRFVLLEAALRARGGPGACDADELVMEARLPARPPRTVYIDAAAYRSWADAVRRRQLRLWVRRALQALAGEGDGPARSGGSRGGRGDVNDGDGAKENETTLYRSVRSIVRLEPRSAFGRWMRVWLACAAPQQGGAGSRRRRLQRTSVPDGASAHLLRLSVLEAERFATAEDVVARLNRLLKNFPRDAWGLARWRSWMIRLAEKAVRNGRFKQALFQYASLVLYDPGEPDGWLGCAAMWEMLGDDARAADCRREAETARKFRRTGGAGAAPEAPDDRTVLLEALKTLLTEFRSEEPPESPLPVPKSVLARAVIDSLRGPDVYLRFLLERWAGGSTRLPSVG